MTTPTGNAATIWSSESTAGWRAGDTDLAYVLVHGALDRSAGLLKLSRRLGEMAPVVRYDRRGYGRSVPHDGPFTMADQVDDLAVVLDRHAAPGRRWVLVGHSYGGNVALAAATRSDAVAAVVYEPPLSWMPWWPHETAGGSAVEMVRTRGPDVAADAAEAFMRSLIGDARWERLPPGSRDARRAEGTAMVAELVDLRRAAPWEPAAIDVPVLALSGADSLAHHRRAADEVAAMLASGERGVIDGARHFGPNTHPDATTEVIGEFVTRWVGPAPRAG